MGPVSEIETKNDSSIVNLSCTRPEEDNKGRKERLTFSFVRGFGKCKMLLRHVDDYQNFFLR